MERQHAFRSIATANNLRIASLSIALYDYVLTLPAEWRFYTKQPKPFRLRVGLVLFVLIRYSSILVLVVSNVGFFSNKFTEASCRPYFMAAPVFKVIQIMISQAILAVRTYNVSRRNRIIGQLVSGGFIVATVLEWFANLYHRIPVVMRGNCTAADRHPDDHFSVWLFYLVAMVYDFVTLCVSTAYLLRYRPQSSAMAHFIQVMLYDGIACFLILTGTNILNLIIYRGSNETLQSSGASLGYAVTWIMSQRILIHIQEAGNSKNHTTVAHNLQSFQDINNVIRSQHTPSRKISRFNAVLGPADMDERNHEVDLADLNVEVRVEHSVVINSREYDPGGSTAPEIYTSPRVKWDSIPRTGSYTWISS